MYSNHFRVGVRVRMAILCTPFPSFSDSDSNSDLQLWSLAIHPYYLQYRVIKFEKLQKGFGVFTSITWWSFAHDGVWFKIRNTAGQLNQKYGWAHLTICMINSKWWNYYWKSLVRYIYITIAKWYPDSLLKWGSPHLEQISGFAHHASLSTFDVSHGVLWRLHVVQTGENRCAPYY